MTRDEALSQDNSPLDPIRALLDHIGEPYDGVWPATITRDLDTAIVRRARAALAFADRQVAAALQAAEAVTSDPTLSGEEQHGAHLAAAAIRQIGEGER